MSRFFTFIAIARGIGLSSAFAPSFQPSTPKLQSPKLFSTFYNDFDDFQTSSTLSLTDSDPLLDALRHRQQEIENSATILPLMILDSMLPRQVMDIQLSHPTLKDLINDRMFVKERPTIGMLGMVRTARGFVPLTNGVEVEIVECERARETPDDSTGSTEDAWDVTLKAKRRFNISGEVVKTEGGWTEARVNYLDSKTEEEMQQKQSEKEEGQDPLSLARAMSKSRQFTQPNGNIPNNLSIIERWIELVRENERHPNQIDKLLRQLGEIPPEDQPTERALWIGALINPLPALGVAMEIRPSLLMAKSAEERVDVALGGIWGSIKHMDGSARMW
jgi:hypothetical protein